MSLYSSLFVHDCYLVVVGATIIAFKKMTNLAERGASSEWRNGNRVIWQKMLRALSQFAICRWFVNRWIFSYSNIITANKKGIAIFLICIHVRHGWVGLCQLEMNRDILYNIYQIFLFAYHLNAYYSNV